MQHGPSRYRLDSGTETLGQHAGLTRAVPGRTNLGLSKDLYTQSITERVDAYQRRVPYLLVNLNSLEPTAVHTDESRHAVENFVASELNRTCLELLREPLLFALLIP